ncbi:hypothetical protein MCY10_005737, partial [Salmonella enterica]|nr:hypothetical protein [Salmonella enterica]
DWVAAVRVAAMVPGLLQKQQVLLKRMVICPLVFWSSRWVAVVEMAAFPLRPTWPVVVAGLVECPSDWVDLPARGATVV